MKKINFLLIASLLMLSMGCRYYTYTNWDSDVKYYNPVRIDLDSGYELYTRQIGKPKSEYSLIRKNYEELAHTDRERIEIQYLLFSKKSGRVLYLTTIPPFYTHDKLYRWIYDEPVFDKTNFVNLWYLNLFYIGQYDPQLNAFHFTRKDKPAIIDTWTYSLNGDKSVLTLDQVTDNLPQELQHVKSVNPSKVFALPMKFYRQDNFQIGISGFWDDNKFTKGVTLHGSYRAIYYANNKGKTDIFFNIGKDPDITNVPPDSLPDDWMHFKDIRVRYKP
ncbi:hypothetical protein SAMN05428975_2050 [Mucilaginibacter sp. OK268]|uniref:hypothetical protein n=1 Tax=Mucilaginibacter sp. OK268 TaxID=1881048 RepID=UPI00088A6CE2|nr:hypothetical protein [Mucilaginibacter sp. OK268]SDP60777.1 hypothetical protein SAMN05428975_2050 [Mucilaginibacter sp. OK268]